MSENSNNLKELEKMEIDHKFYQQQKQNNDSDDELDQNMQIQTEPNIDNTKLINQDSVDISDIKILNAKDSLALKNTQLTGKKKKASNQDSSSKDQDLLITTEDHNNVNLSRNEADKSRSNSVQSNNSNLTDNSANEPVNGVHQPNHRKKLKVKSIIKKKNLQKLSINSKNSDNSVRINPNPDIQRFSHGTETAKDTTRTNIENFEGPVVPLHLAVHESTYRCFEDDGTLIIYKQSEEYKYHIIIGLWVAITVLVSFILLFGVLAVQFFEFIQYCLLSLLVLIGLITTCNSQIMKMFDEQDIHETQQIKMGNLNDVVFCSINVRTSWSNWHTLQIPQVNECTIKQVDADDFKFDLCPQFNPSNNLEFIKDQKINVIIIKDNTNNVQAIAKFNERNRRIYDAVNQQVQKYSLEYVNTKQLN